LNNHKFELNDQDFYKLIRHHQIATVSYTDDQSQQDGSMPLGLE